MGYSIFEINQMDRSAFVSVLGTVFEETPSVAEHVWSMRPFADVIDLHAKMTNVVKAMPLAERLRLIQAHPQLGANAKMAEASVQEQKKAGLGHMSSDENERLVEMNAAYADKFGFPFVMAVKGKGKGDIFAALAARLNNEASEELARSLTEIYKIARFRLDDLIDSQ